MTAALAKRELDEDRGRVDENCRRHRSLESRRQPAASVSRQAGQEGSAQVPARARRTHPR